MVRTTHRWSLKRRRGDRRKSAQIHSTTSNREIELGRDDANKLKERRQAQRALDVRQKREPSGGTLVLASERASVRRRGGEVYLQAVEAVGCGEVGQVCQGDDLRDAHGDECDTQVQVLGVDVRGHRLDFPAN